MPPLARYAWAVLGFVLLVILWGAFVRATGSGAGCGSHWPLCNGVVIPPSPATATLIELTHRITSGLALLLVTILLVWSLRATRRRSPVRKGALLSFFFILTEAAIGAGLVLFERVGDDSSLARAAWLAAHLVNTFVLLACLTLTAWWATGGSPIRFKGVKRSAVAAGVVLFATLIVAVTGAVTALGDTLFPASTLAAGVRDDLSATSHFLVRLRVVHPALAVAVGLALLVAAPLLAARTPEGPLPPPSSEKVANLITSLVLLQWAVGIATVLLLAPIWLQLLHLLLADLTWMALIILTARALQDRRRDRRGLRAGLGRDLLAAGAGN
jgi:heme A synthase